MIQISFDTLYHLVDNKLLSLQTFSKPKKKVLMQHITFKVIRYKCPPRSTSCIIGLSALSVAHFSRANAYSFLAMKL